MPFKFKTKLLASHVALVLAVVLIVLLELNRVLGADLERQLDERLLQQAHGAAQWIGDGRRHPDKLAARLSLVVHADVTIFDHDGNVVGESNPAAHTVGVEEASLPELVLAREGKTGYATRAGPTGEPVRLVAVPAGDGELLRLAAPLSEIRGTVLAMRQRLLVASGVAILAALLLGVLAADVVARPLRAMTASATRLAHGDYDTVFPTSPPDEIGTLGTSLTSLARELKSKIGDLTTERDRLSAILSGMAEGVLVLGADGKVQLANPAAEGIAGTTAFVGKTLYDAVSDSELASAVSSAISRGEAIETELELASGRSIVLYVRPLVGSLGAGGTVAVLRDLTGLRKLMTTRRDFVANVSHELRTPVTAIQGYAETLLGKSVDAATARQFTETMHRHAMRIGALVEGLLRLSELEARAPSAHAAESVDVFAIASQVKDTMRSRAGAADATVSIDVEERSRALGDPRGLEQVMENLVDNAIKYGKSSGGTVSVRSRKDGDHVRLTVEDDGPGIEARHLPRLFERFYRVDPGRSRDKGGSGLGLAIVKHLVESMGGSIEAASAPGKGTRFTVLLPRDQG